MGATGGIAGVGVKMGMGVGGTHSLLLVLRYAYPHIHRSWIVITMNITFTCHMCL